MVAASTHVGSQANRGERCVEHVGSQANRGERPSARCVEHPRACSWASSRAPVASSAVPRAASLPPAPYRASPPAPPMPNMVELPNMVDDGGGFCGGCCCVGSFAFCPCNGCPCNGCPCNGCPCNGCPCNGCPCNGCACNGSACNGLLARLPASGALSYAIVAREHTPRACGRYPREGATSARAAATVSSIELGRIWAERTVGTEGAPGRGLAMELIHVRGGGGSDGGGRGRVGSGGGEWLSATWPSATWPSATWPSATWPSARLTSRRRTSRRTVREPPGPRSASSPPRSQIADRT